MRFIKCLISLMKGFVDKDLLFLSKNVLEISEDVLPILLTNILPICDIMDLTCI